MNKQTILYQLLETVIELNQSQSKETIIHVLFGSKRKKIKQLGLNECTNYGAFLTESITYNETLILVETLIKKDILVENQISSYRFLVLTRKGMTLFIKCDFTEIDDLFEFSIEESRTKRELITLRKKLAYQLDVSPFIIFNNLVLERIEEKQPTNKEEFLSINGLAEAKWLQFGEPVCQIYHHQMNH